MQFLVLFETMFFFFLIKKEKAKNWVNCREA